MISTRENEKIPNGIYQVVSYHTGVLNWKCSNGFYHSGVIKRECSTGSAQMKFSKLERSNGCAQVGSSRQGSNRQL